ncbi:MAG: hypothetical protein D4R73_09120 [Deltaproteobacteria bacterium]|nr:MAG: hypothetical protein D4R73_09120 [Deltaproteobacteria bacterium]
MVKTQYPPEPHILKWLQNFALPTDVVLDVGSGDRRYQNIGAAQVFSLDSWAKAKPDYLLDLNDSDLPLDREFDIILLLDVLEHLDKHRSLEILGQAVRLAQRAVVSLTPMKWDDNRTCFEDTQGFYYQNENILHRSLWTYDEFDESWARVILPSTRECFFGYRLR